MNTVEHIKSKIMRLYQTNPNIHINVKMTHPKVIVEGTPAKIVGAYKNIFQIEEHDSGHLNRHTFQYGDVLIGQVVITELDYVPTVSILNRK
ncbi:MAG: hypothetical protein IJW40_10190 [Clostridia bacterium]|nr:hypothetical protein [Clostridia bacterium]